MSPLTAFIVPLIHLYLPHNAFATSIAPFSKEAGVQVAEVALPSLRSYAYRLCDRFTEDRNK